MGFPVVGGDSVVEELPNVLGKKWAHLHVNENVEKTVAYTS